MSQKIENIKELKETIAQSPVANGEKKELTAMLMPENRQANVTKLDDFLAQSGLEFYEGILAFTDLMNSIFINTLATHIATDEEKKLSNDRINDLRHSISEILNTRKTNFIAEDMVTLLSLLAESVILSISEETKKPNVE